MNATPGRSRMPRPALAPAEHGARRASAGARKDQAGIPASLQLSGDCGAPVGTSWRTASRSAVITQKQPTNGRKFLRGFLEAISAPRTSVLPTLMPPNLPPDESIRVAPEKSRVPRVHVSPAARPRWWRRRSSSSASIALEGPLCFIATTASASMSTRGVICQERPQRSLHQPHWPFLPAIADDRVPSSGLSLPDCPSRSGRRGLAVPELRAAVETETGNAQHGELHRQQSPCLPLG